MLFVPATIGHGGRYRVNTCVLLHVVRYHCCRYIVDDVDHVEQHSSVQELKASPQQPPPTTLADCLKVGYLLTHLHHRPVLYLC